jgi:hypothetical protein
MSVETWALAAAAYSVSIAGASRHLAVRWTAIALLAVVPIFALSPLSTDRTTAFMLVPISAVFVTRSASSEQLTSRHIISASFGPLVLVALACFSKWWIGAAVLLAVMGVRSFGTHVRKNVAVWWAVVPTVIVAVFLLVAAWHYPQLLGSKAW